jgi:hypothetical protein
MKSLVLGFVVVLLLTAAVAWSGPKETKPEFAFTSEKRNPVTHLKLNNAADEFQFAIISDRTGGHRARVFSQAVKQLNLLQPEFVVSVGDLIEGYTENKARLTKEWREFQTYVSRLEMPFFYVPGNHDIANKVQGKLWEEKFGRSYYDFTYRNTLFVVLNSDDLASGPTGTISATQRAWLKKTLEANDKARWTLVFLHQPLWAMAKLKESGWLEVEKLLLGRPYTVFAGHLHRYQKFVRQGQNYYMLATTGGSSRMRGVAYGEFDHLVWVTMKKDGPILANILLDGILRPDLRPIRSEEEADPILNRKSTQPVQGKVLLDGRPIAGAYVSFSQQLKGPGPAHADAMTEGDGAFTLSTYTANDGAPAGDYAVTVTWRRPLFTADGKPGPNSLPERYAIAKTSGLQFKVKPGANDFTIELMSK